MKDNRAGVVEIVRDFLSVHGKLTSLLSLYRSHSLSFEMVEGLVGDDDLSALYRLKERSHAIFRSENSGEPTEVRTEALFDLTVGSLFHEAMILRENLYQQERYGPRVVALKASASSFAPELLREFEKILNSSASRLDEAVGEVDVLLALTRDQLFRLLVEQAESELLARCLYEERSAVPDVFGRTFESVFQEIHGSMSAGLKRAANSYLDSSFYEEALEILTGLARTEELADDLAFARAMTAFLARDYPSCAEQLALWLEGRAANDGPTRLGLVVAAASHIEKVQDGLFSPEISLQIRELVELAKSKGQARPG